MTFKEWMEKNKPEYVDERFIAGVDGCPYVYDLEAEEESEKNCDTTKKGWECCERCWNREMLEESSIEKSLEYFKKKLSKTLSDKRREAYQDAVRVLEYLEHLEKHDATWKLVKDELPPEGEVVLIQIKPRNELGSQIVLGCMHTENGYPEFYEGIFVQSNIYREGFIPEMWMPIRFLE